MCAARETKENDSLSDAPYSDAVESGAVAENSDDDGGGFGTGDSECSSQSDVRESDGDGISESSGDENSEKSTHD